MPTLIPLNFTALESCPRRGEPVTLGLPMPRGLIDDDRFFRLLGPDGQERPLQTRVLDRWPSGGIRWCLFDFLADWDGITSASGYSIVAECSPRAAVPIQAPNAPPPTCGLVLIDSVGQQHDAELKFQKPTADAGAIRVRLAIEPVTLAGLRIQGSAELHVPCGALRFHLTVTNPNPADHPGGNWDLGNGGSIFFKALTVIALYPGEAPEMRMSKERGQTHLSVLPGVLQQHSSGGMNWNSDNHIDRTRTVPMTVKGYQYRTEQGITAGERATPTASLRSGEHVLGIAVPAFWENFPKALVLHHDRIQLDLFPMQNYIHEIQGGEQKTQTFTLAFADRNITNEYMAWARSPIVASAVPEWYAQSNAISYLTPKTQDANTQYLQLVQQALEGTDTFEIKRETIDEYGWRHFGDIWGDHEAVYHPGETPMISHYNNQYDCVAGLLIQYLRDGDPRWLRQGLECADHTCDIDIYHTTGDKSAYNGGLFWHTYHYAPADTGTHRSYPRALKNQSHFDSGQDLGQLGGTGEALKKNYAVGGGPSAAHNYNTGLMLAYYLTGQPIYYDSAVGLADYVINVDDGTKTIFRWLCRGDTGLAIESSAGYSGPGRASGNSLNALLTGHQLTGDAKYMQKAEQVIRRVVHPQQHLEQLDLLNAELRWFYTMFLQALGRYLDAKIELNQLDEHYAYARLSLLHYARWMAEHEHPILDHPEKLQYPTETWAAQDLRKVEVFQYAAKHAPASERARYFERAEWFFRYMERTLMHFPPTPRGIATKSLCRPVILLMNHGYSRAWWMAHPETCAPAPQVQVSADQWGQWSMFTPQKQVAIRRAKRLIAFGVAAFLPLMIALLWIVLK